MQSCLLESCVHANIQQKLFLMFPSVKVVELHQLLNYIIKTNVMINNGSPSCQEKKTDNEHQVLLSK